MPQSTHVRRRVPALWSTLAVCVMLALVGPVAAFGAGGATSERSGAAAASDGSAKGGGDASSTARETRKDVAPTDAETARKRDSAAAGSSRDGEAEAQEPEGAAPRADRKRDFSDQGRSRADDALSGDLGDTIRRDVAERTADIDSDVKRKLDAAGLGARGSKRRGEASTTKDAEADASDDGIKIAEVRASGSEGERIELLPGNHHVRLRSRVIVVGNEPPARAGRRVVLEVLSGGRWVAVAEATTKRKGRFDLVWYPRRPGRYQVRVRPYSHKSSIEPSGVRRIFVYRSAVASWYGPGFYGNRTACGQRFTSRLLGVAHRSLPCGYLVRVRYNGRMKTVPVVDRGPFTRGRDWDLTKALRDYLRFDGVDRVLVTA